MADRTLAQLRFRASACNWSVRLGQSCMCSRLYKQRESHVLLPKNELVVARGQSGSV